MSKVISFSISDRYLDKLRTLYPSLTDNLAAKQFLTDRLDGSLDDALDDNLKTIIESSLSSTLDDVLYERLDGQLKTIIETSLDDVLDERLDATVGKLITSLSERMARLEARLDDMERLLKLQREASIASPIPNEEPSPLSPSPDEQGTDAIETLPKVETVSTDSSIEPDNDAIGPVHGDSPQLKNQLVKAVDIGNRQGLTNAQLHEKTRVPVSTIEKWKKKIKEGKEVTPRDYPDFFKQWRLNPTDNLWHEVD